LTTFFLFFIPFLFSYLFYFLSNFIIFFFPFILAPVGASGGARPAPPPPAPARPAAAPTAAAPTPSAAPAPATSSSSTNYGNLAGGVKKRKGISKADIGKPTDFQYRCYQWNKRTNKQTNLLSI